MATLGYARTSTREQEAGLQAQIRDLIAAGCAERDIYTEQASIMGGIPEIRTDRRPAGLSGAIPKGGPSGGRSERAPCLFVQMARISDFRAVERREPSGGRVISPETVQAILRPKNRPCRQREVRTDYVIYMTIYVTEKGLGSRNAGRLS